MEESHPDYYAILGLDRRCTAAQIRTAYRLLAKRHHPDVNGGSDEATTRLKELNAAHETLSDPGRRRAYDRDLAEREKSSAPAREGKLQRNIAQDVFLRIEEFLRGASLEVKVNDPGNLGGIETYPLTVPPETAPGARFKIERTGPFAGGLVQIRVRAYPSARFKVKGSDLRCDLRITSRRAAQGGAEMIPGPSATLLRVEIPPNVGRGEILRVPGEGLPKPRGGRGDLLVKITYRPEVRVSRTGFR